MTRTRLHGALRADAVDVASDATGDDLELLAAEQSQNP
jgi:hypothetical protein